MAMHVRDIMTSELVPVEPQASVSAVARLPVVEHDRPVGILALGDSAIERDGTSALGGISAARPNT
ncbi:CBS domain-containing protein [Streptomyces sp. NPDC059378]|uniref:CBS domain-containing protein n=1 Tax=Streptomyces sp. NPDC059378 TaxID=3346815 RepID=UPI0036826897